MKTTYTTSDGASELFTTHAVEAELVLAEGEESEAVYRVEIENRSLRKTRKMAVGVSLISASHTTDRVHHVNRYYQSAVLADQAPSCAAPKAPQFVPYAIVRIQSPWPCASCMQVCKLVPCWDACPS